MIKLTQNTSDFSQRKERYKYKKENQVTVDSVSAGGSSNDDGGNAGGQHKGRRVCR